MAAGGHQMLKSFSQNRFFLRRVSEKSGGACLMDEILPQINRAFLFVIDAQSLLISAGAPAAAACTEPRKEWTKFRVWSARTDRSLQVVNNTQIKF